MILRFCPRFRIPLTLFSGPPGHTDIQTEDRRPRRPPPSRRKFSSRGEAARPPTPIMPNSTWLGGLDSRGPERRGGKPKKDLFPYVFSPERGRGRRPIPLQVGSTIFTSSSYRYRDRYHPRGPLWGPLSDTAASNPWGEVVATCWGRETYLKSVSTPLGLDTPPGQ